MNKLSRYKEIESFLFSQLPMFQRVGPKAFKKDLKNINYLLDAIGRPEKELKCIHVAGTNGKGSSCFFMASALSRLGYKVGLYTSPHYKDYRERIKVDRAMIPKSYVKAFVNDLIEKKVFDSDFRPSFFEITVAMAFAYFRDAKLDYAVIETGLGGRLDSTNVIQPLVCLITNIGYDHMAFLGDTLEKIAGEKAGIIKTDVPVVIGKTQPETQKVFKDKARQCNSRISFADTKDRQAVIEALAVSFPSFQRENLYSAYYTLAELFDNHQLEKAFGDGFMTTLNAWSYIGRYMKIGERPLIVFDSAHNPQGVEQLMQQLEKEKYNQIHIVTATVNDKDLDKILCLWPKDAKYYFSQARIPRALPCHELQKKASAHGLDGKCYISVRKAFAAAKSVAVDGDMILVTGSVFTVAELV